MADSIKLAAGFATGEQDGRGQDAGVPDAEDVGADLLEHADRALADLAADRITGAAVLDAR